MDLTRNEKNEGKKRPKCSCGTEMTYVVFAGYYDVMKYWICENDKCTTKDDFVADRDERGAYV